jgi:hypothetical protein
VIRVNQDDHELRKLWDHFHTLVNMSSPELRDWLGTAEASEQTYSQEPDVNLSELGRGVLAVLQKRRGDCTDGDIALMRQVIDLIAGRLTSAPDDPGRERAWRYELMSLGHDPLRADSPRGADAAQLATS